MSFDFGFLKYIEIKNSNPFCMGRRKKEIKKVEEVQDVSQKHLSEETKRSVAAVISVFIAVLFILGFFGIAGLVGKYLDLFARSVFGWGKWLFPILLLLSGMVLLRKTIRFYLVSILGLSIAFIALLGFFHIFFDESAYREIIPLGFGGGYVGYGLSVGGVFLFGKIGAIIALTVLVVIGILVAFNSSLLPMYDRMLHVGRIMSGKKSSKKEESNEGEDLIKEGDVNKDIDIPSEISPESSVVEPISLSEVQEKTAEGANNIGTVRFQGVDGNSELKTENEPRNDDMEGSFKNDQRQRSEIIKEGTVEDKEWKLPSLDIFKSKGVDFVSGDIEQNREIIQNTLKQFDIEVEAGGEKLGPTVTQYMFRPAAGVKLERITALGNNLAMALSAQSIRIEAPIPGKSMVGIEVPNRNRGTVCLREVLESSEYQSKRSSLMVPLGKSVNGDVQMGDLEKMPHLLIAGTTGSGKSVCINAILTALLYQNTPEQLQLILVDPKRVELTLYNGIPHLKSEVIVDNKKVLGALKRAVGEMEHRYRILEENESRNIEAYNQRVLQRQSRGSSNLEYMPFIVIVIDELADLMGTHGKVVEGAIARLAQMSRAVGIHLVIATQRPDVHVLTGLIKNNISSRIAFKVPTQIDSRTILDKGGAEKLLGLGDMLYVHSANPSPTRIQGVFLSTKEVRRMVFFWKKQGEMYRPDPDEDDSQDADKDVVEMGDISEKVGSFHEKLDLDALSQEDDDRDSLFGEAKELVQRGGKASTSLIQRHLRIGYNRAARIIDELEAEGIVGPQDGAKPRDVYGVHNDANSVAATYSDPLVDDKNREKWEK